MSDKVSKLTSDFNNWKKAYETIISYENSRQHLDSIEAMSARKLVNMQIDLGLVKQYKNEAEYWRKVPFRVVSVVKFLCVRGLAFRGKSELIGSSSNGNYSGILELLSEYNALLAEHIRLHASKVRGHLSSIIRVEIIELIEQKVLSIIVDETELAKHLSISVYSKLDSV